MSEIPAGEYLTYITSGLVDSDGLGREHRCLTLVLDEIERQGWQIAGDYFGEVIAKTPAFRYEGRDTMTRLQIPICR